MRVMITGAGRGIGAELRARLLARGDDVIGTARSAPAGPGWRQADMLDHDAVAALGHGIDRLDLLVCNAGVFLDRDRTVADPVDPRAWAESFAINVTAVATAAHALLPALTAARGKIAIISSQLASHTNAAGGSYAYRASKAAALSLGRNLAADLKPAGIAVGIYHPGWVRTDMGGGAAAISPADSASGLMARFDALSLHGSGCFETWDGRAHPF